MSGRQQSEKEGKGVRVLGMDKRKNLKKKGNKNSDKYSWFGISKL